MIVGRPISGTHMVPERTSPWRAHWVAGAIALVGSGVLLYWLAVARTLWVDEEMIALNVRDRTLAGLAGDLWLSQSAPFGWLVVEKLIMLSLGMSEPAVRLLTITSGIGTLATATWIGRRWMTPLGAALLVAMCALGEWIVFFTLELKHYSNDALWALLLPALAVASLEEARDPSRSSRAITWWWIVAAIGIWFANGAVFVAPGCAVTLVVVSWRRGGWRAAWRSAVPSVLWFASLAADYMIVLRHALADPYLTDYWAFAFPPVKDGVVATLRWFAGVPAAFATKPVGSTLPWLFWIVWVTGLAVSVVRRQLLGPMFATVPISAVLLALLGIIPIFERLSLWVVPSMYVPVGLCADAVAWLGNRRVRRDVAVSAFGALAALAASVVAGGVVWHGALAIANKPRSNYGLDDRRSIRRLLGDHRAGDAVATTHFGLVALWWYGGLNVTDGERVAHLPDGSPVFELRHVERQADCERANEEVNAAFSGRERVSVYLGFRMNVLPEHFDMLAMRDLGKRGSLVGFKQYAESSLVAIFDLRKPGGPLPLDGIVEESEPVTLPPGCMTVVAARRW
jgi:hypothetical protein